MPRTLRPSTVEAAQALSTGTAFLYLLTLTPVGGNPIYFTNNNEKVVSRGIEFSPMMFDLTLPKDSSSEMPGVSISLDNVGLELVSLIRNLTEPPSMIVEVVTSTHPNDVELVINDLILKNVKWDAQTMTADLASDDVLNLAWPADTYTPIRFPGLF